MYMYTIRLFNDDNFITLVNAINFFFNENIIYRFLISLIFSLGLSSAWMRCNANIELLISRLAIFSIILVVVILFLFPWFHLNNTEKFQLYKESINNIKLIPIVIFTFNFTPCLQRFASTGIKSNANNITIGNFIIFIFIIALVMSVSHLLSVHDIDIIRHKNVDSLIYTAIKTKEYYILIIAILIMLSLTCGAYLGTLTGIIDSVNSFKNVDKKLIILINVFMCTMFGTINPSIINVISKYSAPILSITVFCIPSLYFFISKKGFFQKLISFLVLLSGVIIIGIAFT